MLRAMGIVALLAFAAHALYAAFAYVCIRGGKEPTRRVLRYGTVFANCGYMGLPLQQVPVRRGRRVLRGNVDRRV